MLTSSEELRLSSHHITDLPGPDRGARVFRHWLTFAKCDDELNCGLTPSDSLVV